MYPASTTTTVFYNPAKPGIAVIETGISMGNFVILALSVVFLLVGL